MMSNIYLEIFIRTLSVMAVLLVVTISLMGKKSIGELPVFDSLTVIVLGSVVGAAIIDTQIAHLPAIFAIVLLAVIEKGINLLSLRYNKFRRKISFQPTIVIKEGKFLYGELKKTDYAIDDVLMFLRQKDCFDVDQVQYGILEANGDLSVLKKSQFSPPTVKELNLQPQGPAIPPISILVEGIFQQENMRILNTTEEEIKQKLTAAGYSNPKDVFYASMDSDGALRISPYH